MSRGYNIVSILTFFLTLVMILVCINTPCVPQVILKIKTMEVDNEFKLTSISMAAVIMIMYNMFNWVEYTQSLAKGT